MLDLQDYKNTSIFYVNPTRYRPWDSAEVMNPSRAGVKDPNDVWIAVPYTATGDYGGCGAIGEANRRVLLEMLEEIDAKGDYHYIQSTMFNGQQLFMRSTIDCLPGYKSIIEVIDGLENYPLACDEVHNEVCEEWKDKAWEGYGRGDFVRAIEHRDGVELDDEKADALRHEAESAAPYDVWRDGNAWETMTLDLDLMLEYTPEQAA